MLRSTNNILGGLTGYALQATDGAVGRCKDLLFDDQRWVVRYLVVDTGGWLTERKVVLSPIVVGEPEWERRRLPVRLSKEQIERAPALEEHAPVSRRYELELGEYFSTLPYWVGGMAWGHSPYPAALWQPDREALRKLSSHQVESINGANLRSAREVTGYRVFARGEEIGDVDDFVLDDSNWCLRYFAVDTGRWLPGRKVLVSPDWVTSIDWVDRRVSVDLARGVIEDGPTYDPAQPVNRALETRLYDYLGRPYYW
jgi:uncharacterized protein YrrD